MQISEEKVIVYSFEIWSESNNSYIVAVYLDNSLLEKTNIYAPNPSVALQRAEQLYK